LTAEIKMLPLDIRKLTDDPKPNFAAATSLRICFTLTANFLPLHGTNHPRRALYLAKSDEPVETLAAFNSWALAKRAFLGLLSNSHAACRSLGALLARFGWRAFNSAESRSDIDATLVEPTPFITAIASAATDDSEPVISAGIYLQGGPGSQRTPLFEEILQPDINVFREFDPDIIAADPDVWFAQIRRDLDQKQLFIELLINAEWEGWMFGIDDRTGEVCWTPKEGSHKWRLLTTSLSETDIVYALCRKGLTRELHQALRSTGQSMGMTLLIEDRHRGRTSVVAKISGANDRLLLLRMFEYVVLRPKAGFGPDVDDAFLAFHAEIAADCSNLFFVTFQDTNANHCLCGFEYPSHVGDAKSIGSLRRKAEHWIRSQYANGRQTFGRGVTWPILSSPYFYHLESQERTRWHRDEAVREAERQLRGLFGL